MKIYSEFEAKKVLFYDIDSVHKWECPICCEVFTSEDGETKESFIDSLFKNGVKKVSNNCMIGVFCNECINEPEFEDSML